MLLHESHLIPHLLRHGFLDYTNSHPFQWLVIYESILLILYNRYVFGYIGFVSSSFSHFSFLRIFFLQIFPCFLDFLDIGALYPAVLTNSDLRADNVPGYLDFSTPFQLVLSIYKFLSQRVFSKSVNGIKIRLTGSVNGGYTYE